MKVRRHRVRGGFGGLLLGISLGIFLTIYGVVLFGSPVPLILAVLGVVAGVGWASVAPNARRGAGLHEPQPAPDAEPQPSA